MSANFVALLRSINVGGNNRVPMEELRKLFARAGASDISTYIQSGNVAFRHKPIAEAKLKQKLEAALVETFGFAVPVVLRTHEELARTLSGNPFLKRGIDAKELHVCFLHDAPAAAAFARLDPNRSPPDEFALVGRELYLRHPNGVGNSKLTLAYLEKCLGTSGTARNWNTIGKLHEMSKPAA